MKEFFQKRFVDRPVTFYIGFAAALYMLLTSIIFAGAAAGDRNFSVMVLLLNIFGAVIWIAYVLLDFKFLDFMPALACACYGVAFGQHLFLTLESLSDVWNGVNFVGGNAYLALAFAIVFAVGMIISIAMCFMRDRKTA